MLRIELSFVMSPLECNLLNKVKILLLPKKNMLLSLVSQQKKALLKRRGKLATIHRVARKSEENLLKLLISIHKIKAQLKIWKERDSGIYMLAYAEYLSSGEGIPTINFDAGLLRTRYATLLWNYVQQKLQVEAISASEAPPKPNSLHIDHSNGERIVIS